MTFNSVIQVTKIAIKIMETNKKDLIGHLMPEGVKSTFGRKKHSSTHLILDC